jgi:hypothetical protein
LPDHEEGDASGQINARGTARPAARADVAVPLAAFIGRLRCEELMTLVAASITTDPETAFHARTFLAEKFCGFSEELAKADFGES